MLLDCAAASQSAGVTHINDNMHEANTAVLLLLLLLLLLQLPLLIQLLLAHVKEPPRQTRQHICPAAGSSSTAQPKATDAATYCTYR
jgi:hypothetical protein